MFSAVCEIYVEYFLRVKLYFLVSREEPSQ